MHPAALLAAFVLLVALPATGAQDPQASFDSRLNFPTDFGQPSCIQWDPNARALYLVGSTSFYANGQLAPQIPRAEYYGVQVMRIILDDLGNTVSTDLSGRLFDGIAGACLLGEGVSAGYMFIGVDGGVVFTVSLADWSYVTDMQLGAPGDPSAFVSGMTWYDDGNFTQFYVLLSNPPALFLMSNTLAILQESRSVFFNITPYATRTTLPIVHDAGRGKVLFPAFSLGNPSPFGNSDVNIVAFEDTLIQDTWGWVPLGLLGESDPVGDVWDYRPSAIFNPGDQYSYWGISNYVVAIDHSTLSLAPSNISVPYITSLNFVPGDPTKAWAVSSTDADTSIGVVDLIAGANTVLSLGTVLDIPAKSSPPCAGWTWAALFLPATASANELYTWVAWNPGNVGTSYLCVLQNTTSPDAFDILPIVTSTSNNVFGIGAIIFDPNSFRFYTCGLNFLTEWQYPLSGGNQLERTNRSAIPFSGYCWEVIQTDNNTLVFHDTNNVFTVRLDTWQSYTHNVMQFAVPGSSISWITHDPAKNRIYVSSSESRMFVVDLSSPYVDNLTPLPGINLPPAFINSQIILLDPGNQAIYLGNCAPISGGNATLIEMNTATAPLQVTRVMSADKSSQGEYCFATASWIDYNTHRTFWVDANLLNPVMGLYNNPGLRANGTSAQPGSSYGAAIDRAGRQTYVLGRDTVSALSLPRSVLWRRCWDDDAMGNARVPTVQPTWLRVFDTLDGQFSSRANVSYFLVWDYIAQPSILRFSTPLTCPLVNTVAPPPGTLPPVTNPTQFPNPTPPQPTGTAATTGRPTPTPTIVDDGKKGLSGGAIAGIVIFAIIFTGAAAALIFYLITHRAAASGGASAGSAVTVGSAGSGGAVQGASSGDRDGHQRFHDEDSGRF